MAKKVNKEVSVNKIETLLTKDNIFTIDFGDDVCVEVKRNLSLDESMGFISYIYNCCINEADENSYAREYLPESFGFALRYAFFKYYTNIRMPSDQNACYDILYKTDVFESALEQIDKSQYEDNMFAVREKIKFAVANMNSSAEYQANNILLGVNSLIATMKRSLDDIETGETGEMLKGLLGEEGIQKALLDFVNKIQDEKEVGSDA